MNERPREGMGREEDEVAVRGNGGDGETEKTAKEGRERKGV